MRRFFRYVTQLTLPGEVGNSRSGCRITGARADPHQRKRCRSYRLAARHSICDHVGGL